MAEVAGVERFKSEDAFPRYVGAAPIPHWSGDISVRERPTRRGNHQLNAALHRIAVTQIRLQTAPAAFITAAASTREARQSGLRALKRRLCRAVFQALKADRAHPKDAA